MEYGYYITDTAGNERFFVEGCSYCQMSTGGQHEPNCPYKDIKIAGDVLPTEGLVKRLDVTQKMVAKAQAEISFKAGRKELIDWIIFHKRGYRAEPDGTLISVVSAEWTEEEWQSKLKEWNYDRQRANTKE